MPNDLSIEKSRLLYYSKGLLGTLLIYLITNKYPVVKTSKDQRILYVECSLLSSDLISFSKAVESAGANMICIHARTYCNPYKVPAFWDPVYALKDAISIPVLGNGGIVDIQDGLKKIQNLDGFLIGQASFGNPWVFLDQGDFDFKHKLDLIVFL